MVNSFWVFYHSKIINFKGNYSGLEYHFYHYFFIKRRSLFPMSATVSNVGSFVFIIYLKKEGASSTCLLRSLTLPHQRVRALFLIETYPEKQIHYVQQLIFFQLTYKVNMPSLLLRERERPELVS